jgi:hypothetical protein
MSVGAIVQLGGAHAQLQADGWVLFGCPDGTATAWKGHSLPPQGPARIVFHTAEPNTIAGLFAVLCALTGQDRKDGLEIIHPLFDEGVPSLVEAWIKSARPDFPVSLETAGF